MVKAERLFVEVAEQMERFDGNVGALDGALQETPKILQAVGMNLFVHVGFRVVNDAVDVSALSHPVIRAKRVSVETGAGFDVLRDDGFQLMLLPVGDDLEPNLRATVVFPMPFEQAHYGDFANHGTRLRNAEALS